MHRPRGSEYRALVYPPKGILVDAAQRGWRLSVFPPVGLYDPTWPRCGATTVDGRRLRPLCEGCGLVGTPGRVSLVCACNHFGAFRVVGRVQGQQG